MMCDMVQTKDVSTLLLKTTIPFNKFEPDQSTVRKIIYKVQEIQSLCDLAKITAVTILFPPKEQTTVTS